MTLAAVCPKCGVAHPPDGMCLYDMPIERPKIGMANVTYTPPPDPDSDLDIQALLLRAWSLEVVRKGGDPHTVGAEDVKCLQMAQRAIAAVRQRMPVA